MKIILHGLLLAFLIVSRSAGLFLRAGSDDHESGEDVTLGGIDSGSGDDQALNGIDIRDDEAVAPGGFDTRGFEDATLGVNDTGGGGAEASYDGSGDGDLATSNKDNRLTDVFLSVEEDARLIDGDQTGSSASGLNTALRESNSPVNQNFKETVVFFKKTPNTDEIFYIFGRNPAAKHCSRATGVECAIPIKNIFLGLNTYSAYERDRLAEKNHYLYRGPVQEGPGTPAILTSNVAGAPNFSPLNTFGPDFWMARFKMDCSRTRNGYFEVIGYYEGQLEAVHSPGPRAFLRRQPGHTARCGYLNVFTWGRTLDDIHKSLID